MITPDASLPLCSRCHARPRQSPQQRWCQKCLTQYKLERYWRLRALNGPGYDEVTPEVLHGDINTERRGDQGMTPTPAPAARPIALCRLCATASWFEWSVGDWRCRLCGIRPPGRWG
jgi:hypothetical protein